MIKGTEFDLLCTSLLIISNGENTIMDPLLNTKFQGIKTYHDHFFTPPG